MAFHLHLRKSAPQRSLRSQLLKLPRQHHQCLSTAAADPFEDTPESLQHEEFPHLFSMLKLKNGIVLDNRVIMGSMHTGLEGHSMPKLMERVLMGKNENHMSAWATYLAERASAGIIVTGGIAPNHQGWVGPFAAQLTTEKEALEHEQVTQRVHTANPSCRLLMQILHTGRYGYHPFAVSASNTKSPISPFPAKALSVSDIHKTIDDYVTTAQLAEFAGYDGVELMGSEGYLVSQFLNPLTNLREDEYGNKSLENRARFFLELVKKVRQSTSPDFIIMVRLSLLDLVEGGLRKAESMQIAQWIQDAGATILNTGIGWHESRIPTIHTSVPRGAFVSPTAGLDLDIPVVATNRINTPHVAERILSDQSADLVSMARPFLADPEWLLKAKEGRSNEINVCIACNQACLDHSFQGKTASCLVNPRACHETEIDLSPLKLSLQENVSVVGAGPAGCAFAIAAAQKGHAVTLYDSASEIGGQFQMARRIPGKEEFSETLRYLQVMLKKHGVKVKLGTQISMKEMEQSPYQKWILATGVNPRVPKIEGSDHLNVVSYTDVLRNNVEVGQRVAIIGAGGIGFDVAEFLLHEGDKAPADVSLEDFTRFWGVDLSNEKGTGGLQPPVISDAAPKRRIHLLQRKKSKVGAGLGKTTGWIHRATLQKNGVSFRNGINYDKVDSDGNLHISTDDGKSEILNVDTIIVCAGQVERRDLWDAASETLQKRLYLIGGAERAGELDAKRAMDMGMRLASKLHEPTTRPGNHVFAAEATSEEKLIKMLQKFMK